MQLSGISIIGWLHSIACLIALAAGLYVLAARKGTATHRRWGWWYVGSMLFQNLSVMVIYRFDVLPWQHMRSGPGIFGLFHFYALLELLVIALAVISASRQARGIWAYVHAQAMLFSYYIMLNALCGELFVRIAWLHTLAMQSGPHVFNAAFSPLAGHVRVALMGAYFIAVLFFRNQVARRKRSRIASGLIPAVRIA